MINDCPCCGKSMLTYPDGKIKCLVCGFVIDDILPEEIEEFRGSGMTLVVHWGNGEKSIFDGLSWEVHSRLKTLTLFDSVGHKSGKITIKNIHEPSDKSMVYHVWTDATGWLDYKQEAV